MSGFKYAARRSPPLVTDPNCDRGIRQDILHPLGLVTMLRQDVEATVALDEPDFDLTWKAALAAYRREIYNLGVKWIPATSELYRRNLT